MPQKSGKTTKKVVKTTKKVVKTNKKAVKTNKSKPKPKAVVNHGHIAHQKVTTNVHIHDQKPKRNKRVVKPKVATNTITSGDIKVTTSKGYSINNQPSLPYIAPAAIHRPEPGVPEGPHQPIHGDYVKRVVTNPTYDHPYHVSINPAESLAGRKFDDLLAKLPSIRTPPSPQIDTPSTSKSTLREQRDEAHARGFADAVTEQRAKSRASSQRHRLKMKMKKQARL
jgi:hypothetical protein